MKTIIIAAAAIGAILIPGAAHATKPLPPIVKPCPDWAPPGCKPVVVFVPPPPPWTAR